jgi:hypothetical protein
MTGLRDQIRAAKDAFDSAVHPDGEDNQDEGHSSQAHANAAMTICAGRAKWPFP